MQQPLKLQLFGLPRIHIAGEPIQALLPNKARALLFYLAINGQTYTRNMLTDLLWPTTGDAQAKRSLRELLFISRRWLSPYLVVTRHTLAFNQASLYELDVEQFRQLLSGRTLDPLRLQQAIALYEGEFLQEFGVRDAPDFEAWLLAQRQQSNEMAAQALEALADHYLAQADYPAGLATTQRLLTLQPWCESAHRRHMLLLARSGQRSAALQQYATCQRILQEEYAAPPAAETVALYEQIRQDSLANKQTTPTPVSIAQVAAQPADKPRLTAWANWTAIPHLAHFCGRRAELDTLHRWVNQTENRLIALYGIGGQGKSALVATLVHELAKRQGAGGKEQGTGSKGQEAEDGEAQHFEQVLWRSVQEAPPLTELVQSWLHALTGQSKPATSQYADAQIDELITVLQQQRCLLILDHVEAFLQPSRQAGCYRPGFAAYAELFRRLAEQPHRSCIILISRECPLDFARLANHTSGLQLLPLTGLTLADGRKLLQQQQLTGADETLTHLIWRCGGHPLALREVGLLVHEFFGGDLAAFLQAQALICGELREQLDQQFIHLPPQEQAFLWLLAQERRPIAPETLWSRQAGALDQPLGAPSETLDTVRSLLRRGLLEQRRDGFALPALLSTYLMTCHGPTQQAPASNELDALSLRSSPHLLRQPRPPVFGA